MTTVLIWCALLAPLFICELEGDLVHEIVTPLAIGALSLIGWVIYIIIMVIISWLTADSGGTLPGAKPKEFDAPEITVSDPIPVLFGTQFIRNTNVVWYGNVSSEPWERCT